MNLSFLRTSLFLDLHTSHLCLWPIHNNFRCPSFPTQYRTSIFFLFPVGHSLATYIQCISPSLYMFAHRIASLRVSPPLDLSLSLDLHTPHPRLRPKHSLSVVALKRYRASYFYFSPWVTLSRPSTHCVSDLHRASNFWLLRLPLSLDLHALHPRL
jgi:hypothetical protein